MPINCGFICVEQEKALVLCDLIHLTSAQDSQIGADIFVEVNADAKKDTRFNIAYSVYGAKTVYEVNQFMKMHPKSKHSNIAENNLLPVQST